MKPLPGQCEPADAERTGRGNDPTRLETFLEERGKDVDYPGELTSAIHKVTLVTYRNRIRNVTGPVDFHENR